MPSEILDIFNAHKGVVCCVGAGGKKTTMFRLAREHAGRRGITATSHIEYFPRKLKISKHIAEEDELLQLIKNDPSDCIAFACPSTRKGRHAGISVDNVKRFQEAGRFDLLVIKSDGARSRLIKAPAEHEPPLPACVDTVIPVVSARAMGKPLSERIAHRIDRISAVAIMQENDIIKPVHVARLLTSAEGALRNTGDAEVIPLINMVDNRQKQVLAQEAAELTLSMTDRFNKIVLARMRDDDPIVDVITS